MDAFWKLYLANLREFARDRMTLFWTLAFPLMFIVIFGVVFTGNPDARYEVGLAVEDEGPAAAAVADAVKAVPALKVTEGTRDDLMARLKDGKLRALIVVPAGLSAAYGAGQPARVQTYYDPSNQASTQIVLGVIARTVDTVDQQLARRDTILSVEPVSIASSRLRTLDFFLPGVLAMSLMQLGIFGTAPALVQLREQQVLRRIGATPLPRLTLLGAQVAHRLTVAALQTATILLVGTFVFKINILGNGLLLAGLVLLGTLMFVAMGYLISGIARTQDSANGLSQVINFPMMFLSGLFFPVDLMPSWLQPVASLLPLTFLADALRQVMVGATPLHPLALDAAVVSGWLIVCAVLAIRFFRWE